MKEILGVKYYTVKELVEILGVSRITILEKLKTRKLKGRKVGRPWYIAEEELREFLAPKKPIQR